MSLAAVLNSLMLASLLAFSHGLLKWVAVRNTAGYMETLLNYWWVIGIAMGIYVFIFFYYAYILRTIALGALYPAYTGLSMLLVFLMGVFYFGEAVSIWQIIGCLVIIIGVFLVSGAVG